MKTNKIYISGKISGLSKYMYELNFEYADTDLFIMHKNLYINSEIINPLQIKPLFGIKSWLFYIISDLWKLRKCTHIALQKNWLDSKGAVLEYFFSKFIFKQQIIFL